MRDADIFANEINSYVRQHGTESIMDVDEVLAAGKMTEKKGSILPTDFCYNRYNNGLGAFEGPHLFEYTEDKKFKVLGENYPYTGNIFHKPRGGNETVVGRWDNGALHMGVTEIDKLDPIIKKRRDYLIEWLKQSLKEVPVNISAENNTISVNFQELLICGIDVEPDVYKIYNASSEWANAVTYHCEESKDGTWYYYLETAEECIDQCKQLVLFEAKKGSSANKKSISGKIDEPLVSDYWLERIKEELKRDLRYGEYVNQQGVKKVRIECYGQGPRNRMQIWLNPPTSRTPEYLAVWIGDNVLSPSSIKTDIGEKKVYNRSGYQECEIKFSISQGSGRAKDLQNAFDFINEIRALANK